MLFILHNLCYTRNIEGNIFMKRKFLVFICIFILFFSLTGCKKNDNKEVLDLDVPMEVTTILVNDNPKTISKENYHKLINIFEGLSFKNETCDSKASYTLEIDNKTYMIKESCGRIGVLASREAEISEEDLNVILNIINN